MRCADVLRVLSKYFNYPVPSGKDTRLYIVMVLSILLAPFTGSAFEGDLETDLQSGLDRSRKIVISIQKKLLSGGSESSEITQLKSAAENIRVVELLLEERFKLREEKVKSLGSKAVERQQAMAEGYKKALMEYLDIIDGLPSSSQVLREGIQEKINSLKKLLDSVLPKKKRPILGTLPYKHVNYPAQEPNSAPPIIPAYKGGNKIVAADDTKVTPEAPISQEIAALAQSLNWNPVSIYEFVKNNIETEWYFGCMKGAEDTLHQKSGNDCDQATLLTALLRASGFPTRYVRGVIEFFPDIEQVKNVTGVEDRAKIAEFFQKAGIPYIPVVAGGKISNFHIEHIWVESLIPYANYRGAIIDECGKTWLGLDTSIKVRGYTSNSAPDILSPMSLLTIQNEYLGLATSTTGTSPFTLNQTPLEYLQSSINAQLIISHATTTYSDYLRTRTLIPEVLNIIPASVQFTLIKATNEYTALPDELIHQVKFTATDLNKNDLFTITLPSYKLSNQQLAMSYEPETVQDQEIIDSYGGLDNTPAYLVHLRPVLKVNDERIVVARGGVPMGGEFNLVIELISPNGSQSITNSQVVGNLSVIGISAQRAVITPSPHAGEGGGEGNKTAEQLLYQEAINYIERWNKAEEELASLLQMSITRPIPSIVTVGGVIDVTYLLDTPHGFTWKGVFVDADVRVVEVTHRTPDLGDRIRLFMQFSSLQGSILENRIFEDDFQVQSISAAKLFQLAIGNTQFVTIDKSNISAILPTLTIDDNIKDDITNAVNQNLTIRTPQSEITYQDWTGIGYIKENPSTGESGWMLSGIIAGGMTAWDIDKWNAIIAGTLSNPYSEPASYDPATAQYIEKIMSTDVQDGTAGNRLDAPLQVRVLDSKKKPVMNVPVSFTIKAGGGTFGNDFTNIITTTTAITNAQGVASATPTLGRYTKDNPTYIWEEGDTYSQQVGENIVDAALPSGTRLIIPFTALGLPNKENLQMKALHGDGYWSSILSFAGFVSVSVEDKYANPVSNIPVNFTSIRIDHPQCSADTLKHFAALVNTDAACIKQSPVWGDCGDPVSSLTVTSSRLGAAVEVILGSVPNATYPIITTVPSIATAGTATFNLHTYEFGNCAGNDEPSNTLMMMSVELNDGYGNNINAGKTNSTIPVFAKVYYVREGEKTSSETLSCSTVPLTCSKIVGDTTYRTDTEFTSASMTFSNAEGTAQGGGVFKSDYQLQPGKNTITINATAAITINKSQNTCSGCNTEPNSTLTKTGKAFMTVYGVTVQTQAIPMLLVNESGHLGKEQTITYTIEPLSSDYTAMSAYTMIYKDGSIVAQIPTETKGTGIATISRGFQFDPNSIYEAEVILNYGTGVEIRGNRVTIPVAQIRVLNDEIIPKEADEIKFSDGSKGSNGTKKYHIEIKSQSWLSSCETLTGRIVTLSTATATAGQPVNSPQNTEDAYAAEYTLAFNHPLLPLGNNLCNVQIVDTLDNGSRKDKFILSNRPKTAIDVGQLISNIYNTAVLYGGIGNKFWVEVGSVGMEKPIEPVGIVILGIDGLRQDVLYAPQGSSGSDVKASYPETNGCKDQSCFTDLSSVKGICAVMGGKYTETLGISSCDPAGAENKHIKLPNVTTIFPSITFAAWASIFTGMTPSATGITGNEFFARDLYHASAPINFMVPGMNTLPSGMVTLDADGGAMRAKPTGGLVSSLLGWKNESAPFALNYVMPAEFLEYDTLSKKLASSSPGNALKAVPLWKTVNDMVTGKYQINTADRCDQSANECRTVSIFNQYAAGVDWWGTPSVKWMTLWKAVWDGSIFDSASTSETVDFINNYFKQTSTTGKRKRFPALFSVYLPGLDHDAHMSGMGHYRTFVQDTLDAKVSQVVSALKGQDEFDNKIFVIVSDHGHTAMPTDLTYRDKNWLGIDSDKPIDTSCELKTDFVDINNPTAVTKNQKSELENNNLHIWELGEVFKQAGFYKGMDGLDFAVMALQEIASLYDQFSYGAKPDTATANVIAALNGPMAHIYIKNRVTNSWTSPRMVEDIGYVAELLRLTLSTNKAASNLSNLFPTGLFEADVPILASIDRLINSVDFILVRRNNNYEVFYGIQADGLDILSAPLNNYTELGSSLYVKALKRIADMNHPDRSGDVVLVMRDFSSGDATDRYTTAYACKSWHGSLNPSDSYVPLILSYPGGNKSEVDKFLQNVSVCPGGECEGNWNMADIVKGIINKQYGNQ